MATLGFVDYYNHRRYHKALSNVTPNDVLKGGILIRRREVKAQTLASRQRYNRQHHESSNTAISPWSLLNENVPLSLFANSYQKRHRWSWSLRPMLTLERPAALPRLTPAYTINVSR